MDHATNPEAAARTAALLAGLTHIDNVGFHGIATNLAGASPKIDRNWSALIRNARIAVAVVGWPAEIQPMADGFTAAAEQLADTLDKRDTGIVAGPAKELHVAYHALSDAGWSYLAMTAGITQEDTGHHHGASHQAH
ncbi:hypothetical protein [Arthrobacter cavernae]|uniref:Uncharacterized protein n=1 Tax=Arthrobacter cavernae TaxID=2817681 RepID=A0A939KJT9_9MICC|nr:hypothetical protein [Arthrobacter cavernae]MBO1268079.1 hypothetical protein [Arthrobacter cavernae]